MKKIITLILLLILVSTSLSALTSRQNDILELTATVPEDYGVNMPQDSVFFDRFAIQIKPENGADYLLQSSLISLGVMEMNEQAYSFSLVYYGNLKNDYDVRITIDAGHGWSLRKEGQDFLIPIEIVMEKSADGDEDIVFSKISNTNANILVPATGPRRGVPVVDVKMKWNNSIDLVPGIYNATLYMNMEVN